MERWGAVRPDPRSATPDAALADRVRAPFLTQVTVRLAFAAVLLAAISAVASRADDAPVMANATVLHDFMIQNVCLDAKSAVLIGHSPAERDPACVAQRDLHPGEPLPYHKH